MTWTPPFTDITRTADAIYSYSTPIIGTLNRS